MVLMTAVVAKSILVLAKGFKYEEGAGSRGQGAGEKTFSCKACESCLIESAL